MHQAMDIIIYLLFYLSETDAVC